MQGRPYLAYLLVNAATALWAGNVVLGRALRHSVGPWTLAGLRAVVASAVFAVLLRRLGRSGRPWTWTDRALVAAMAVTGVVGFQVLQYAGLRQTTALNAGLVNALAPVLTLLVARAATGAPWRPGQVVGAVGSLAGVAVILSGGSWLALRTLRLNPGDVLVLAAALCWVLYSVAGRAVLARHDTVRVTALSTLAAVPALAVPAGVEWAAAPPAVSPAVAAAVLYIGIGPSLLAFLAWNEGVRRLGPNGAMAFYNTLPLYAGLLAGAFLGEWPGGYQLGGGALVVAGCLVAARASGHDRA